MRKLIVSTAALAILAAFPMGGVQIAQAAVVEGSDVCGELPNVKWSWEISSTSVQSGGETSTTIGDVTYQGAFDQVGKADVTTTTSAIIETTTNTCTAINPAGVPNDDHSTTTTTVVEIAPATSSTVNEVVCNPGSELPDCPL
ncbi:hypothetical protein [Mesorhizobium sp. M00.F.Ca.ET.216.01.1.1]|uniref:hypothetical protein n=1 Tax=Mesorhizobium sp. M00.F.Ca.ET.216.01.1.1 TaxID=2500528 RepID=UPI000FDA612D|nr:hypothetical protein [Mesorhizobium sp. M00.F.Ca.ET.216.01.1.1]TGQ34632.1 hypothetical protein EN859_024615 [Mesorhizobium sp. M00.F.Ca.ET.216.01.1.1]TJW09288.1 MAG: hypothetical protein E5W82_21325 [Mesorhizobium sp.]TJW42134.1 MAG: hypothetical protein E5W83_22850 [Mesorhizobium sp.]